jgi:hypothetical protein
MINQKFGRLMTWFNLIGKFIAAVLASMLSVFVPQDCGSKNERRVCSFQENIDWTAKLCPDDPACFTNFNKVVLVWNCFSVLCFAALFWYENKRESWLSKYLDIERTQLADNLVHTRFWTFRGHECKVLSHRLFYAYLITLIVFIFNVIVSGMFVLPSKDDEFEDVVKWNQGLGGYYLDFKTITVFYSSVSLIFAKLLVGTYYLYCICLEKTTAVHFFRWEIAKLHPLPWGLSTVAFEPSSYNAVAPEICLKELGAEGDMVASWRTRRPNGKTCPHVPRIAPERICNCTESMTDDQHRGFIMMI